MTLTSKVLIVGEQPTEKFRFANQPALGGRCARRLVELMDLMNEEHLRTLFDVENLFSSPAHHGERWVDDRARMMALRLAESSSADFLVLCGARVQRAFQVEADCAIVPVPMLTRPTLAACIPHPSGRCRSWSDKATELAARTVLGIARDYVENGERFYCHRHAGRVVVWPLEPFKSNKVFECGCEVVR